MKRWIFALSLVLVLDASAQSQRWSEQAANAWYAKQPWLVGSNYIPATAINELEMWQADSFDPKRIDLELGWAESLGMNTMRVFLHDLLWTQDSPGFQKRIDTFLNIASRHHIRPMFVLFDSCWDPFPQLGKQRPPKPGVHNSGWMQSPGAKALQDLSQLPRLETYVKGVVGRFAKDNRVLAWDLWNEPDNTNGSSYGKLEPANKVDLVLELLPKVYDWARAARPTQPLTSGVWKGDWSAPEKLTPMERVQLEMSDVISFHNYDEPAEFEKRVKWLQPYKRPILCTEYMARGNKSTFQGTLPVAKKYNIAVYNWGLVAGKTQTFLPWDSWQKPYVDREPTIWFHEVFRTDGTSYRPEEVEFIRQMTGKKALAAFAGTTPTLDGILSPGEWSDATRFTGVLDWSHTFTPTTDPRDLALVGYVKHDGKRLYFAFDVTDDVLYGIDTPRWLPKENSKAHELTREGYPWFGDEMELLINATNRWTGHEIAAGNGSSWQMVCNLTKSRLDGVGKGGLLEGEPRSKPEAWNTYQQWIKTGAQQAVAKPKPAGKGYIIEWAVSFDPCLEVEPGKFYSVSMGDRDMGLNIALGDLDEPEKGTGNFGNFHHEDWFSGDPKLRTELREWGTLRIHTTARATTPPH